MPFCPGTNLAPEHCPLVDASKNDPLKTIDRLVRWESFRAEIEDGGQIIDASVRAGADAAEQS